MEYTVLNIFGAYIEYFALYTFLWIFFDTNPTRKHWRFGCHIIMPVLFWLFASYISSIQLRPVLFIICSCCIALGFSGVLQVRLFSVSIFQVCLILLEFFISYLVAPNADFSRESTYLAINLLVKISTVIVIFILFFISKRHKTLFPTVSKRHTAILLSFSITSFFLVMLIDYLMSLLNSTHYFVLECIAIALCIFTNIAMYYLFYQLSIGEEAQRRLELMNFHLNRKKDEQEQLDQTYQEIRKISHDMKRYLSIIYNLLQNNKVREAMDELQKQQLEISNHQLFDTGYPVLNSVLSYKIQVAQKLAIQPQLLWNLNCTVNINISDIAVILSNALENAIEATSKVLDKRMRFLSIVANSDGDYIIFKITNSTATIPTIVDGKITTTKSNTQIHGFGLESIKTLAQKYHGDLFIEFDNYIFTLTVVLKNIPLD